MTRRTLFIIAVLVLAAAIIAAAFSTLIMDKDARTPSQRALLTSEEIPPSGHWGGGGGPAPGNSASAWHQPDMQDVTDGTFELGNMTTYTVHVIIWIVLEHYNSTATARAGYDGLKDMLVQEGTWNVTEVEVGERAFIAWNNWTDDNGSYRISNLIFQKEDFTAVLVFDIRGDHPWTLADSIGIARLQSEKID